MAEESESHPKVFISYSHDCVVHNDRVLALANRLRHDGIDAVIDQYWPSPPQGFQRWMMTQIRDADFVLLVCTEPYYRRMLGEEESGKGQGATFEGKLILQYLYESQPVNEKFIPVLPPDGSIFHIPEVVRDVTRYHPFTDEGYEDLYRRLTDQPAVLLPELGTRRSLPPHIRTIDILPIPVPTDMSRHETQTMPQDEAERSRQAWLDELARVSRVRCLDRWQANGLSRDEAEVLFEDDSHGDWGADLYTHNPGVMLIHGELGIGKSLYGERYLQRAIRRSATDSNAPLPVYTKAHAAAGRLRDVAEAATGVLGNSRDQGVAMVVDGLDEAGLAAAETLLGEAQVLAATWPNTRIVLTSRPLPIRTRGETRLEAPLLSDTQAIALIGSVAGREIPDNFTWTLPSAVREAITRPLFAILVGVYLREHNVIYPRSRGEILDTLVERAVERSALDAASADVLLHRLAIASIDHGGVAVASVEIGTRGDVARLLSTRLVVEHNHTLNFPLPLLTQWFAAQAVAAGTVSPNDLVHDQERLERWRYPLILLAGTMGHDTVTRILLPIVQRYPAFASQIVNEGLTKRFNPEESTLPRTEECGERLYSTMSMWAQGLGSLAPQIVPLRPDGTVTTVGVVIFDSGDLMTSWYRGNEPLPNVVNLAGRYNQDTAWRDGWPEVRIGNPIPESAWAWRWTFEKLCDALTVVVNHHTLPLSDGPLVPEILWQFALRIVGQGSLSHEPIFLTDIEARFAHIGPGVQRVNINGHSFEPQDVRTLTARLRASGMEIIRPPWPGPDIPEEELRPNWV